MAKQMSTEELIWYCELHCTTERALFSEDQINRMLALAGYPQEYVRRVSGWNSLHGEMEVLCKLARQRLKDGVVKLIAPIAVHRREDGYWTHPELPGDITTKEQYEEWKKAANLEVVYHELEYEDPNHPGFVEYYDEELGTCTKWTAKPPEGEGWFTLCIDEGEDGPRWHWARELA